jgi:hypothetical protein
MMIRATGFGADILISPPQRARRTKQAAGWHRRQERRRCRFDSRYTPLHSQASRCRRIGYGQHSATVASLYRAFHKRTDVSNNFVRILGSGGFACTDRPDRLIGDNDAVPLAQQLQAGQSRFSLHFAHIFRLVQLHALRASRQHRQIGVNAVTECRMHFFVDESRRFPPKYCTAFRVADDDVVHAQVLQHHAADLTGDTRRYLRSAGSVHRS